MKEIKELSQMKQERNVTVLVIDDEPANLGVLFEHLRQANFRVLIAEDGTSALERVERFPPDIILLDVKLPDVDGFELCRRLKEHKATQDTPIIFMTVMMETADKVKGFNMGAVDYITKPLQPEEVIARVEKHLTIRSLQKQLEERNAQLEREIAERVRTEEVRRQAEEALREQNKFVTSLFESLTHPFYVVDVNDYTIKMANSAARLDELSERSTCYALTHKRDQPCDGEFPCPLEIVKETGKPTTMEHIHYDEESHPRYVEVYGYPIFDREGRVVQMIEYTLDITERKRAEEEIRQLDQFRESVIDNANVWLNVLDAEANVVVWNKAAEKISGYSREEVVGHDKIWEWLYPDEEYRNEVKARAIAIIEEGGDEEGSETTIRRKDGETRIISWNSQNLVDERGNPMGSLALGRDVTERKQMEEQLRQHERLAAIGQLAGGIAHDFNNLLATIVLYAQMSQTKRGLSPDVAQAFEIILEQSRRAAKLVQQILDFSRRSMMAIRPLDLVPFTENVLDILRRTIPENIHIALTMGPEEYAAADRGRSALTVEADPARIQQALMNLATNARDAMPEGGGLHIGLSRVEVKPGEKPPITEMDSGKWVCLTISDTGMGMTEEVQAHLFEPFFTTKPVGAGTGLGLAQVYGIVKQHKGHIGVETATGEGTTFRIYLPAYEEEMEKIEVKEPSAFPRGRGETILVVEDEARLRTAIGEVLESLGYRVLTAADGQEALETYRSAGEIGLVLADLVMPKMGGKQLIRELRRENPDLKALAITGYVMDVDLQELEEAGFLGVVSKPFDTERLAKTIRRTLDAD